MYLKSLSEIKYDWSLKKAVWSVPSTALRMSSEKPFSAYFFNWEAILPRMFCDKQTKRNNQFQLNLLYFQTKSIRFGKKFLTLCSSSWRRYRMAFSCCSERFKHEKTSSGMWVLRFLSWVLKYSVASALLTPNETGSYSSPCSWEVLKTLCW